MFSNQSTDLSLGTPCRALDCIHHHHNNNNNIDSSFRSTSTSSSANDEQQDRRHHDDDSEADNNNDNTTDDDAWWVAGTADKLYVLQFHAHVNELTICQSYPMNVDVVCCCPNNANLVLTVPEQGSSATLSKLPTNLFHNNNNVNSTNDDDSDGLEEVANLLLEGGFGAPLVQLAWNKQQQTNKNDNVLTLDNNGHLTQWDMDNIQSIREIDSPHYSSQNHNATAACPLPDPCVAWDPHSNGNVVALAHNRQVSVLDWRAPASGSAPSADLLHPHPPSVQTLRNSYGHHRGSGGGGGGGVSGLDYNPNKPHILATCGHDGMAKFWDLRCMSSNKHKRRRPLLTARGGHSHWISSIRYNPFHDQLVVTTGTDGLANLWRMSSISSAPILLQEENNDHNQHNHHRIHQDVRIETYEHGDSCYTSAWASSDPWMYATVSYEDGKVVLHHVPSNEKYKILL